MNSLILFLLYPALAIAGAIFTQLAGNNHRYFTEGLLAWLFLPIMMLGALSVLPSEGVNGLKSYLNDFLQTFLNYEFDFFKIKSDSKFMNT